MVIISFLLPEFPYWSVGFKPITASPTSLTWKVTCQGKTNKQYNQYVNMETEGRHTSTLGMQTGRKQDKSKREWRTMRRGKSEPALGG